MSWKCCCVGLATSGKKILHNNLSKVSAAVDSLSHLFPFCRLFLQTWQGFSPSPKKSNLKGMKERIRDPLPCHAKEQKQATQLGIMLQEGVRKKKETIASWYLINFLKTKLKSNTMYIVHVTYVL